LNTALLTAQAPLAFAEARRIPEFWERLVESAVGAQAPHHHVVERVGGIEARAARRDGRTLSQLVILGNHYCVPARLATNHGSPDPCFSSAIWNSVFLSGLRE
jgi:hypothetical protein